MESDRRLRLAQMCRAYFVALAMACVFVLALFGCILVGDRVAGDRGQWVGAFVWVFVICPGLLFVAVRES